MNLNKYTKTELISKLKNIKTDNKTFFDRLIEIWGLFKNMILRISIVMIILKIFRHYRYVRIGARILNYAFLSIFGYNVIEILQIDALLSLSREIKWVLSQIFAWFYESWIWWRYGVISGCWNMIWGIKTDINPEISIKKEKVLDPIKPKMQEWFGKEEVQEETRNKKYYIIAGMLILAILIWWKSDEIKGYVGSLFNRRGPDDGEAPPILNTEKPS